MKKLIKAELTTALARRYWEDDVVSLETLGGPAKPLDALRRYPWTFRWALENEHCLCFCSFMSAQFDDLPESVKAEVQTFADVDIEWLKKVLAAAKVARNRVGITLSDSLVEPTVPQDAPQLI